MNQEIDKDLVVYVNVHINHFVSIHKLKSLILDSDGNPISCITAAA